jgi:Na+-transporting methylmalonyl-CoA/oxaloacetate decarboxylase gamma subunit
MAVLFFLLWTFSTISVTVNSAFPCEVCSERTYNTKREAEKKTQIDISSLDKFKSA